MNDNAKALVEALRSGNYKQGKNVLRRSDSYCCLGVACALYQKEHPDTSKWVLKEVLDTYGFSSADNYSSNYLTKEVREWLGFSSVTGTFDTKSAYDTLADGNDRGSSFEEIADLIESEPPGLFK